MPVAAQATPVTCLVECAPLCTCTGLYCSSGGEELALRPLEAAATGTPRLMLHVTSAPPDLPAATRSWPDPAGRHQCQQAAFTAGSGLINRPLPVVKITISSITQQASTTKHGAKRSMRHQTYQLHEKYHSGTICAGQQSYIKEQKLIVPPCTP